jgi:hypothetical protein
MALTIQQISPVSPLPVVLGEVLQRNVAALITTFCPPHPAPARACGRGVEALPLAILVGIRSSIRGARLWRSGHDPPAPAWPHLYLAP